jgi:hypothetical protein
MFADSQLARNSAGWPDTKYGDEFLEILLRAAELTLRKFAAASGK